MNKKIVFATNLNVWSMGKGVGAPSFYKTLDLYNDKNFKIYLYTTEQNCDLAELENINIISMPKLEAVNIRYLYSLHRFFNYFFYQFIFVFYFLKSGHFRQIDLFYGYEIEFIPALHLLSNIFKIPYISRFQGTILHPLMNRKLWKLRYFPHYLSLKLKSNLTIMTDDGTKGDIVIEKIRGSLDETLFLKNGVEFKKYDISNISSNIKKLANEMSQFNNNFISVSRLQNWKRVDRSLDVYRLYKQYDNNCRFIIVGSGESKIDLERYVLNNGIQDVIFTGGINADEVNYLLYRSNIFLSHYELSNVGNPLWEAINNQCLVVTINNGDTGKIIRDNFNGIVSNEDSYLNNAEKLFSLLNSTVGLKNDLIKNATNTLREHIVSWEDRMFVEYKKVETLL